MTTRPPTTTAPTAPTEEAAPTAARVVESFLEALAASELDRAMTLVADDVVYTNVGLLTVRGRQKVRQVLQGLSRPAVGFEVRMHAISAEGSVVLTERTDVISFGRFRAQFWVWGRFDVDDDMITLWRDSFDFVDVTRGMLRGLIGIAVPSLRPVMPDAEDSPGR